jgi:hypothetical protein
MNSPRGRLLSEGTVRVIIYLLMIARVPTVETCVQKPIAAQRLSGDDGTQAQAVSEPPYKAAAAAAAAAARRAWPPSLSSRAAREPPRLLLK